MNFKSLFASSVLGLDIQPGGIWLVQLRKKRNACNVVRVGMSDFPVEAFTEGKLIHWDPLRTCIVEMVREYSLQGMSVVLGLPAPLVKMQHIQLPAGLTDEDIQAEIRLQWLRDFPGMADTLCCDFEVVSQQAGCLDVFFSATREAYLLQYIECVQSAGLKVKVVDVDIYALKRAIESRWCLTAGELYVLARLMNTRVVLVGFNTRKIVFHQHWELTTGDHFSLQLQHYLQLHLSLHRIFAINKLFLSGVSVEVAMEVGHVATIQLIDGGHDLLAYGLALRTLPVW